MKEKTQIAALLAVSAIFGFTACGGTSLPSTPTSEPTSQPTSQPTSAPTSEPTSEPTSAPTSEPTSAPTSEPSSSSQPVQDPGLLKLNSECPASYNVQPYNLAYGGYGFEMANTSENNDGFITLSKGGYILNTTAFGDIDSFKVEFSVVNATGSQSQSDLGFGGLYYVTDHHSITSPRSYKRVEATSGETVNLADDPNFIAFYTFNEIKIESITIDYDETATFTEAFSDFDFELFATNDIHGQVNSDATHAGLNNAAGYIEANKKDYNLLFDEGDIYQGSLACYLTQGHIMDDYLLTTGYESTILGNHEWDWMEPNILSHREYSPMVKMLACNVRYKDGSTPSWVRNYYTTSRGGVKFGVIGALGDIAGDISADMIENIQFLTGDTLTDMVAGFADELKEDGCDYIILQIHAGSNYSGGSTSAKDVQYTEIDYSNLEGKLDLVLESHSHHAYFHKDQYGIAHMQNGGYFTGLGKLDFSVTFEGDEPTVELKRYNLVNASTLKGSESSFFKTINDWYADNVYREEAERVIGTAPSDFAKAEVEQMQADAYYNLKNVYSELDPYEISCGGGYLACRSPQKIAQGDVTMSDVTNLFPFDNQMLLCKINGKDFKYNFLNKSSYKLSGPMNASSTTNFKSYYYIIIDSYNFFYLTKQLETPCDISIVINLTEGHGIFPRDAFAMYFGTTYPKVESYEVTVDRTCFDYDASSASLNLKGEDKIAVEYANLADNASYSQFNVKKTNGSIKFDCPSGYKITEAYFKEYGSYKNLTFYKDSACSSSIDYTVTKVDGNGEWTLEVESGTLVVKNASNYDVKLFQIVLTVEKVLA